jgi:hypothetical protein
MVRALRAGNLFVTRVTAFLLFLQHTPNWRGSNAGDNAMAALLIGYFTAIAIICLASQSFFGGGSP